MIKRFKNYFGFISPAAIEAIYPSTFDAKDNLGEKVEYLKALDDQESSRLSAIETKTSQLIGQAGIVLTLLGLFIANFLLKSNSWPLVFRVLLITLFLICFFFYLCTIFQGTKYFNIIKYSYGQRSISTVKNVFNSKEDFKVEEIKDLIYSIERNTQLNNLKGNNLMYAYRSFRLGTIVGGLLVVSLIFSVFFSAQTVPLSMKIETPIQIKGLDSAINVLQQEVRQIKLDAVILKDTCLSK